MSSSSSSDDVSLNMNHNQGRCYDREARFTEPVGRSKSAFMLKLLAVFLVAGVLLFSVVALVVNNIETDPAKQGLKMPSLEQNVDTQPTTERASPIEKSTLSAGNGDFIARAEANTCPTEWQVCYGNKCCLQPLEKLNQQSADYYCKLKNATLTRPAFIMHDSDWDVTHGEPLARISGHGKADGDEDEDRKRTDRLLTSGFRNTDDEDEVIAARLITSGYRNTDDEDENSTGRVLSSGYGNTDDEDYVDKGLEEEDSKDEDGLWTTAKKDEQYGIWVDEIDGIQLNHELSGSGSCAVMRLSRENGPVLQSIDCAEQVNFRCVWTR